jgi:F0F1-type ATP synthase gamma subunit
MSQQSYNHNLLGALDALKEITRYKQLLDIALENTATVNKENFDRVTVLLESFNTLLNSELDSLDTHLIALYHDAYNEYPVTHRINPTT